MPAALAQSILTDGTTSTTVTGGPACSSGCTITGSTVSGGNLFHSFQTFNVDTGATVTFNAPGLLNVITRVTGSNSSAIDGVLAVSGGNANLFVLNPNGLDFGPNAQLQLGGSFVGSTASNVLFADGTDFGIDASDATSSLLSINTPVGLQTGSAPATVAVNGSNLAVNPQRTLVLVGGNVSLTGGTLVAPSGRVEVGGLGANQTVGLATDGSGLRLSYDNARTFADLTMAQGALANVIGPDAGTIQVQGKTVDLSQGSALLAYTTASGGGEIVLHGSEAIQMSDGGTRAEVFVLPGATGDGSDQLTVQSPQLTLTNGAQIGMGMAGMGASGRVDIQTQTLVADGADQGTFSGVYAAVLPQFAPPATGQGGDLLVQTDTLRLSNGGQLVASTFSAGDAGDLTVRAETLEVLGFSSGPNGGPSGILSASEVPAPPFGPPPLPDGSGNGGTVTIETARLLVANGGQVSTGTRSNNSAGALVVNVTESVELRGQAPNGRSGLFAGAQIGNGRGGDINVSTDQLIVRDGATINVSNFPSTSPGLPPGNGPAGNLNATARTMLFDNGAVITADTVAGDFANINLQADVITLNQESLITTNATGPATGGNISITTDALTALRNSDITANAEDNFGGRVSITSQVILGTEFRDQLTPDSDITATSALGPAFSGVVDINTPETNSAQDVTEEPDIVDPEPIVAACEQVAQNEFVVTGRGGLSADPTQVVQQQVGWTDLRLSALVDRPNDTLSLAEHSDTVASATADSPLPDSPTEAQGWALDGQNRLVLVASGTGLGAEPSQGVSSACGGAL